MAATKEYLKHKTEYNQCCSYKIGLEIIFLELPDKISDGILLTVGHDRSLYFLVFLHQVFSCGFTRNLTWLCEGYVCTAFSFYWLFVNATIGDQ